MSIEDVAKEGSELMCVSHSPNALQYCLVRSAAINQNDVGEMRVWVQLQNTSWPSALLVGPCLISIMGSFIVAAAEWIEVHA